MNCCDPDVARRARRARWMALAVLGAVALGAFALHWLG
jgi:hypothetical protein